MPLSVGDKLGPYEILARVGAGGLTERYQAVLRVSGYMKDGKRQFHGTQQVSLVR